MFGQSVTTVSPGFVLGQCTLRLKVVSQKRAAGVEATTDGGSDEEFCLEDGGAMARVVTLEVVDRDIEAWEVFDSAELIV